MAAVPHATPSVSGGRLGPTLKLVKAGPDSQVGTPVRVFALVLLLGAIGAAFGLFVLGGPAEPAAAPKVIVPWKDRQRAAAKAPKAAAAVPAVKAKPAAAAKPKPKAAPVAAPKPDDGLPAKLSTALAKNRVVVAALYAPDSKVSLMSGGEAQAGAKDAGAGFVLLNVYARKEIEELTATLGVMSEPTVLVFRRPDTLVVKLGGFADRALVEQAAANAAASK